MVSIDSIIESELRAPTIFRNEAALDPDYVPERLPHREEEVKLLASYFKALVESPGEVSVRVLITGRTGVGKTVTTKLFGSYFSELAWSRYGVKLRYIHINCQKHRSLSSVLREIKNGLGMSFPDRGFAPRDYAEAILEYMERSDTYAIVTLDDFDQLTRQLSRDELFFLVRLYDDVFRGRRKRMSFIYIIRFGLGSLYASLDEGLGDYVTRNLITFKPYTSDQLRTILWDRVKEAFKEGTVDEGAVDVIAEAIGVNNGGPGSARTAIVLLHRAGKYAEYLAREGKGPLRLLPMHVRHVMPTVDDSLVQVQEILQSLSVHHLLLLKAVAQLLLETGEAFVRIGEVEERYRELCREIGERPRGHTKVYEYVMDLARRGVIVTKKSMKGRRGRSTYIGYNASPLDGLIRFIDEQLGIRRGW